MFGFFLGSVSASSAGEGFTSRKTARLLWLDEDSKPIIQSSEFITMFSSNFKHFITNPQSLLDFVIFSAIKRMRVLAWSRWF